MTGRRRGRGSPGGGGGDEGAQEEEEEGHVGTVHPPKYWAYLMGHLANRYFRKVQASLPDGKLARDARERLSLGEQVQCRRERERERERERASKVR